MEVINTFVGKLLRQNLRFRREWFTDVVNFDTGKNQMNQIWERPKRHWILPYKTILLEHRNNLSELAGRAKGRYNVFLFEDPYDNVCTLTECSITAVGGETTTQLIKTYYGSSSETWNENITRIQPETIFPPIIKIDAAIKTEGTHFTLNDDTGIIDWTGGGAPNGALGAGEVVTANYRFYRPVNFEEDEYSEETVYVGILNTGDIPIVEVIE